MGTHYSKMTVEHLGPDATEHDLEEFVEICVEAERIHPEIEDITESVFGNGDYYSNAEKLGVDVDAIMANS